MAAKAPMHSFDVTCVVGTVIADGTGEHAPHVAAMMLIAEHDAPGVFSFPTVDGRTQIVTVEFVDPQAERV